ncbi:ABC transporter G family protein [Tieghemostelium lacteum]|uniref:ABC transporter G family protein n=1 Tax=Tieghemostelium lacteum TaxID=361077 RepID=A0A151Z7M2_TIELA|nr:ABC transporter G family protein [Tieghemostelium lacteum]|eukprot:KYQ89962.1 ABC transporter G family protein [Tieghemostelium lacteum]
MEVNSELAIQLINVNRSYGSSKVIENLNLNIKKGTINALVGASGCGKTTLLKIILGRLVPDSGEVRVFGMEPYSSVLTVPGSLVGYAPQENALYTDITIEETLQFFATLHNMSKEHFQERKQQMIKLLDLPPMNRIVGSLSGGQKRRVSLAIALLHSPKLCILDEPTVGLDPLLRTLVINHLKDISATGVTVIITTHYIEEARVADKVFLMRNGKILENGEPEYLIQKYDAPTLEDVFLQICRADESKTLDLIISKSNYTQPTNYNNNSNNNNNNLPPYVSQEENSDLSSIILDSNNNLNINNENSLNNTYNDIMNIDEHNPLLMEEKPYIKSDKSPFHVVTKTKHILAIGKRKLIQILRNKIVLFFELFSPTFQIVLYFLFIGGTPKQVGFGVVNQDLGIGPPVNLYLGADLIANLQSSGLFQFHYYNSTAEAIAQVKLGVTWGVIEIPENFSMAWPERLNDPTDSSAEAESNVQLYMDFTNFQITQFVQQELQTAFEQLGSKFNISMNPVEVEPAIFGSATAKFLWFLAPGFVGLITFAHSIGITAVSFVREKIDGSLDRLFAYNVSTGSIIMGHFLGHIALLCVQAGILLLISILGFGIPIRGDVGLVLLMVILNGFVGMSLGLLISGISKIETEAIQLSLACYFPTLIMSGTLWPLQGIPIQFRWIPNLLPATHAAAVLRDLMLKGVSFTYPEVYQGFLIVLAWFIGLFFLSTFALKEREKNFNFKKLFLKKNN